MLWRHILGVGSITLLILTWALDGTEGHFHTLPNLCVNKDSLGHIQQETGYSPEPVLISTEQRYAMKRMTSLHYFRKTSCTLLTSQVQRIGNHGVGGGQCC